MKNKTKLWLLFFLLSSFIYLLGVVKVGSAIWGDAHYYYAYTRSLVIDRNIDFINEAYRSDFGFPNPPQVSIITGKVENNFSPGAPILWIPGFVFGQIVVWLITMAGVLLSLDGYSFLTQSLLGVSTVGFSVGGLWLVWQVLRERFSEKIALFSVATLFFTTQLIYYTALDPLNSHSASFLVSALILWLVNKIYRRKNDPSELISLGLSLGLLGLIRNQNILLAAPILIWLWIKTKELKNKLLSVSLVIFPLALLMSIQVATTHYLFGQFGSPYQLSGQRLSWFQPDFIRVLFSWGNGLFNYAPVALVSLFGLGWLVKKKEGLAKIALTFFLLELYLVASWVPEIVGGPYGSRMFTATLPWLSLGLAKVWQWGLLKNKRQKLFFLVVTLLTIHNAFRIFWMLRVW